jgi:hypothetical protein
MSFARPVLKRLLREARSESGLSLIELLIVMLLMGMLLGTITTILVSGIGTQSGLTATFGAETNLHTGLGKLRTDVNLACSESAQSATSVTLVDPPCDLHGRRQVRGLPDRRLDLHLHRAEQPDRQLRPAAPARRRHRQPDAHARPEQLPSGRRPRLPQRRPAVAG